jgi:hypothetical protein
MTENHLSGMKARNGTLIFVCSTCKEPPNFTFGAQAKGELVYLMLCPKLRQFPKCIEFSCGNVGKSGVD